MSKQFSRREFSFALPVSALLTSCGVSTPRTSSTDLQSELKALEQSAGGRLGVCIFDSATKTAVGHRQEERFGMCSTFKLALAAFVLRDADAGVLDLNEFVPYSSDDLQSYAPVTTRRLKQGGMTIRDLAEAAQSTSDNTATNLLLKRIGGPDGFTRRLRSVGDNVTRLDRNEPAMNLVPVGELRDTTTPLAMATTVSQIFTGDFLKPQSLALLERWVVGTRTGGRRLRAGLPADWKIGNKTGTGIAKSMPNKTNDIAVIWPPAGKVVTIACYYDADQAYADIRLVDEMVLADVGRLAADWLLS